MPLWLALLGAYIIGSVDFAVLVARSRGVDIHTVGSGNPGTSNILRTLGKGPAAMVLVGDMTKGVIGSGLGFVAALADHDVAAVSNEPWVYLAGFVSVLGHAYPVFHRFRGGKGVATGGGVLLFAVPLASLILAALWALLARVFKVASIASLVGVVVALPLAAVFGARGWALVWLAATLLFIVYRHLPNIRRMIQGSEEKVPT